MLLWCFVFGGYLFNDSNDELVYNIVSALDINVQRIVQRNKIQFALITAGK